MKIDNLVEGLKNLFNNKLRSVVLYGSKVSQEDTKYSDHNILIVVDDLNIDELKKSQKLILKWAKNSKSIPLIFKTKELLNSLDVFPIEFLDIKQNNIVLYGEDLFSKIEINTKNLRHECEFELRSKLLKLRQAYILTKSNPKKIKELLIETISTFLVLFKSVIQLTGKTPPSRKSDTLAIIKDLVEIDTKPFETIILLKQEKIKQKLNFDELFKQYITQIEKVIEFVDKF